MSEVPGESLQVGAMLHARGPEGENFSVRILEVKAESVILDLNHPLAGLILNFDVRVLSIQTSEAE
jgi:FKBP-type peptidyl-prolyl cis-trans isomerase 2